MPVSVEIDRQGDHEYLVTLSGDGAVVESWVRVDPVTLHSLGFADTDEERVVRHTVAFLLQHQDVPDFPKVVELEDVVASYDDYPGSLRPT
jgi:hypothetical protein